MLAAVSAHQVVVLSGATGCGKTTQVPQMLLEDWIARGAGPDCNILVTQPRRIAAISVAERVAAERCEPIGAHVGYQVRFEQVDVPKGQGRIIFATVGTVLRRLFNDADLAGVSHVIVDEVHERDVNTDFLLVVLRQLLRRRPELRVIVMSATLDAEYFADYFKEPGGGRVGGKECGGGDGRGGRAGNGAAAETNKTRKKKGGGTDDSALVSSSVTIVKIPGKLHPIQRLPLERLVARLRKDQRYSGPFPKPLPERLAYHKSAQSRWQRPHQHGQSEWIDSRAPVPNELLVATLEHLHAERPCGEGAVLVFLPGWKEIEDARKLIERSRRGIGRDAQVSFRLFLVCPLFGRAVATLWLRCSVSGFFCMFFLFGGGVFNFEFFFGEGNSPASRVPFQKKNQK